MSDTPYLPQCVRSCLTVCVFGDNHFFNKNDKFGGLKCSLCTQAFQFTTFRYNNNNKKRPPTPKRLKWKISSFAYRHNLSIPTLLFDKMFWKCCTTPGKMESGNATVFKNRFITKNLSCRHLSYSNLYLALPMCEVFRVKIVVTFNFSRLQLKLLFLSRVR